MSQLAFYNPSVVDSTPQAALFQEHVQHTVQGSKTYMYGRADSNLSANAAVIFVGTSGSEGQVQNLTKARLVALNYGVAVAAVDVPSGSYGWFQIIGRSVVASAAGTTATSAVYTAGSGDVGSTAGSETRIQGMSVQSIGAGVSNCYLSRPMRG